MQGCLSVMSESYLPLLGKVYIHFWDFMKSYIF